jgi:hypothetical protein
MPQHEPITGAAGGKREVEDFNESIVMSVPANLRVKGALAWKILPRVSVAASGSFNNWPRSLLFVFQPQSAQYEQKQLPADVGENLTAEVDLLYRPNPSVDLILGGEFQAIYSKYNPPHTSGFLEDGSVSSVKDTAEVKEYIYSSAPRFLVKKSFQKGDYIRAGASYHFTLFDYQFRGARQFSQPSLEYPSYRLESFDTMIPRWKVFADGTKLIGENGSLYAAAEFGQYPNALTYEDTEFAPVRLSLINLQDLVSGSFDIELACNLTRIFNAMVGVNLRFVDIGEPDPELMDDRQVHASLKLGTSTRFYRNLWWSVRIPALRITRSDALGSAVLFNNRSYIETEILFVGL